MLSQLLATAHRLFTCATSLVCQRRPEWHPFGIAASAINQTRSLCCSQCRFFNRIMCKKNAFVRSLFSQRTTQCSWPGSRNIANLSFCEWFTRRTRRGDRAVLQSHYPWRGKLRSFILSMQPRIAPLLYHVRYGLDRQCCVFKSKIRVDGQHRT